ncbi:MAG: hypothetical protein HY802_02105 [Methanobacterium sp.]|nr:hypothetical protein [Methanobacterium sp.]
MWVNRLFKRLTELPGKKTTVKLIGILEGLEPTKEIEECIEILEEVKKIEGW